MYKGNLFKFEMIIFSSKKNVHFYSLLKVYQLFIIEHTICIRTIFLFSYCIQEIANVIVFIETPSSKKQHGVRLRVQALQGVHGDGQRQGLGVDPEPGQVLPEAPAERDAEAGEGGGEPETAGDHLQL